MENGKETYTFTFDDTEVEFEKYAIIGYNNEGKIVMLSFNTEPKDIDFLGKTLATLGRGILEEHEEKQKPKNFFHKVIDKLKK